jgi:hypothetical protein
MARLNGVDQVRRHGELPSFRDELVGRQTQLPYAWHQIAGKKISPAIKTGHRHDTYHSPPVALTGSRFGG